MERKQSACALCGKEDTPTTYRVALNFKMFGHNKTKYGKIPVYAGKELSEFDFAGFGPCYLHIDEIALCSLCRDTLSPYFLSSVYGTDLEMNRLLIEESKEVPSKIIPLFERWVLEFIKNEIALLFEHSQREKAHDAKTVGISYESLNDVFRMYRSNSRLVCLALDELVEQSFLQRTSEAGNAVFWGPVTVETMRIDLAAPDPLCVGEAAFFSLKSSHGGFVRITVSKDREKISQIQEEVAANKEQLFDIQFPDSGDYRILAEYLRVEKGESSRPGEIGLILNPTDAKRELKVKVRPERPSLKIENPFVDAGNPADLRFVTSRGVALENVVVELNGRTLSKHGIKESQGRFEVTLRGNIESIPGVHLLSLRAKVDGELSCPAAAELIAFKVERPEKFRIAEEGEICVWFPRSYKHAKMLFEVGWRLHGDFVRKIVQIPPTGRIEFETPILKGLDELILRLKDQEEDGQAIEYAYSVDVEPVSVEVNCKSVKVGSTFTVEIFGVPSFLDQLEARVVAKGVGPIRTIELRSAENCILLEGIADISGDFIVDLRSPIPFLSKMDRSFHVRTAPELVMDKPEYKMGESPRLTLYYDPAMNVETIQASVSYHKYFSRSDESIAFRRARPGCAETVVHELPPCAAKISVKVMYEGGVEDLLEKDADVYGVLLEGLESD